MSDIDNIIWGALSAVFVYVVGQLLSKFFIEPLYELRKAIGEVRFVLEYHRATIHTPAGRTQSKSDMARDSLMKCSSDLISKLHAVPKYNMARAVALCGLPGRLQIEQAAVQLRGLSTYLHDTEDKANSYIEIINKRVTRIMKLLRLKPLVGEEDA